MEIIENKDLFQTVFDSASNGITVLQTVYNAQGTIEDFTVLMVNQYTLNWLGEKNYKGKPYGDVFPRTRNTEVYARFIKVAETGIRDSFEYCFTQDLADYWFRFSVVKQEELLIVTVEDITELKLTAIALDEALQWAERQKRVYDSIIDNTPDLAYVFELDYTFSYANKALLNMWGKSAEDAIGKGLRENGYEEWHALMHEREIDDIVKTKKPFRGTVSFPHAELGRRVYDYILTPVINEAGKVEAVSGITRDVTEQIAGQKKMEESERRFRNMIEQAPVAIGLTRGTDFIFESINAPMLQLIGKNTKDDVMGKPLKEVLPELTNQRVWEILENVVKTKEPFEGNDIPADLITDGVLKTRYFNISYSYMSDDKGTPLVLHMAVDVTDQVLARRKIEESETRLKSMIDQTPAPTLVLMGDDLVIEQINKPMLQLIGRGEEIIGLPLINVLPELEGQYIWEQVLKVYHEGTPFDQWEVKVPHNRGGDLHNNYYNIAYRPLVEEETIIGMIQVAIDVTEQVVARKKLEESESQYKTLSENLDQQVTARTKELKRSNEDLQQFAHVASHDLKEPVRKIKTFTSRLEEHLDGNMDDVSKRFIERIHVASDRMFTMIDGVLAYSKINADLQEPVMVDLNDIIENIQTDLEVALQKTGGTILHTKLPVIEGAQVLLYQLFYNLVNNSIKFARADVSPRIEISAEVYKDDKNAFAVITVADNGIGFEPSQAGRIFETFTRLNSKDQYEGTGLGLALCKKIVERHGGTITANGSTDEGAAFTIKLPLKQEEPII